MRKLKVVHLSTLPDGGGAFTSVLETHLEMLKLENIDSYMVTNANPNGAKIPKHISIQSNLTFYIRQKMSYFPLVFTEKRTSWSHNFLSQPKLKKILHKIKPDLIHLHWIGSNFIPISFLRRLPYPIVWTFRDWWAFTGGCHEPITCSKFHDKCGNCPILGLGFKFDFTYFQKKAKLALLNQPNVYPVFLSKAMQLKLRLQKKSIVIPNGIHFENYTSIDKEDAKKKLGLNSKKNYLLFVASSTSRKNKGFELLIKALLRLKSEMDVNLIIVGNSTYSTNDFNLIKLGFISNTYQLSLIYSATQVCIVPSFLEAFGKVGLESISCGTPIIAFKDTGISEYAIHQQNAYLLKRNEPIEAGIKFWLNQGAKFSQEKIRGSVIKSFSWESSAKSYLKYYNIVKKNSPS